MLPEWGWIDLLQMLGAVVLGLIVGMEREMRDKPAGVKTLSTVTLCSVLLMQLSLRMPAGAGEGPGITGDPARLAAAVMTGIGFLGAGVIMQRERHVEGITTAATIWLMAGVGLAIGAGYYVPAVFAVLLVMLGFITDSIKDRLAARMKLRLQESESAPEQNSGTDKPAG